MQSSPESPASSLFEQLPESERWQGLNARSLSTSKMARAGTVRTTVLANRRQTLAVLGYIGAEASTFERLALAGRMLKEVSSSSPASIGLIALDDDGAVTEGARCAFGGRTCIRFPDAEPSARTTARMPRSSA